MDEQTYIRWLKLPPIPKEIIDDLPLDFSLYEQKTKYQEIFFRSDSFIGEVDQWCRKNICDSVHWGFQIIKGDAPKHRDLRVSTKFHYVILPGGDNVYTRFYSEDGNDIAESIKIPEHCWHIFKADSPHSVDGIEPGKTRFSITGKIF
jgi:hypothetical protein